MQELADISEFLNATITAQSRIDTNWAVFLSINSAILGGVVLIERVFNLTEKSFVIFVYTLLSLISCLVNYNAAQQLQAIYADMILVSIPKDQAGYHTVEYLKSLATQNNFWTDQALIPFIYLTAYIIVVAAIIFDEKFTFTKKMPTN